MRVWLCVCVQNCDSCCCRPVSVLCVGLDYIYLCDIYSRKKNNSNSNIRITRTRITTNTCAVLDEHCIENISLYCRSCVSMILRSQDHVQQQQTAAAEKAAPITTTPAFTIICRMIQKKMSTKWFFFSFFFKIDYDIACLPHRCNRAPGLYCIVQY